MKKAFVWVLSLLILASGSFATGRFVLSHRQNNVLQASLDQDNRFRPAEFPLQHRSFVIFICAFNDGAFVERTLRSVFSQVYDNYRLIYIDDASTDGSFDLARDAISQSKESLRATVVHNTQRLGLLANLVRAVQVCQDQDVVVVLHPQDFLSHEWVLNLLNQYYADPDLWLTYSQYREFPTYHLGSARSYQQSEWGHLRQAPFSATHLQTFAAALFKRIKESDLLYQGAFLPQAADVAFMMPMLEMAQDHFQFIPEILTVSHRQDTLEDREQQIRCERYVRGLNPYAPLMSLTKDHEEAP